jgi:hypothetical protein
VLKRPKEWDVATDARKPPLSGGNAKKERKEKGGDIKELELLGVEKKREKKAKTYSVCTLGGSNRKVESA